MGRPPKTRRNRQLVKDRKRGLSWHELAVKYGFKDHKTAREIYLRETAAA